MKVEVTVLGLYSLGGRKATSNLNCTIREHMVVPMEANHALTILYLLFLSPNRCGMEARCRHKEVSFKAFDGSLVFNGGRNGVPDSTNKGAN